MDFLLTFYPLALFKVTLKRIPNCVSGCVFKNSWRLGLNQTLTALKNQNQSIPSQAILIVSFRLSLGSQVMRAGKRYLK